MKTRREFMQGLIVSVGGAAALSACGGLATITASSSGNARFYSSSEMALLSRLSDLIIPRTETPGALDANVPGYMDTLMTEWANDETRAEHREAMQLIAARLDSASGNFLEADEASATAALTELDAAAFDGDDSLSGYRRIKGYITQSYFATEEGAVQELKWVAVPGRWDPSVDIAEA